jgi:ABC-type nickel/cobalt efflux system permease component RcnA
MIGFSLLRRAARYLAGDLIASCFAALAAGPALAQFAQRPFSVGGGEGGGGASGGLTGWIMAAQSSLTHVIATDVKALHDNPAAVWGLVGIGFAYGVVHAAGPGHGKAVIASYMLASDRALKRGLVLAFLAAMLQGAVAVALVGVAALIFNATSAEMNHAANWLALASYGGLIAIGLWLMWTKGRALLEALRARFAHRAALADGALYAGAPWRQGAGSAGALSLRAYEPDPAAPNVAPEAMSAAELAACGHSHMLDPSTLEAGFSWRGATATVLAAGSRPCSGAILVLVFALAQGLFSAGILATFAMSLGVALTTGALAVAAVFAKRLAMRMAAGDDSRIALAARGVEFLAALLIVAFGVALLLGAQSMA